MRNQNTAGLTPITRLEVVTRLNTKLADEGLQVRPHIAGFALCNDRGEAQAEVTCLDSLAIDEGVLADHEYLAWPEELAKAA